MFKCIFFVYACLSITPLNLWSDFETFFMRCAQHVNCGGPTVNKSGYDEGIPWAMGIEEILKL